MQKSRQILHKQNEGQTDTSPVPSSDSGSGYSVTDTRPLLGSRFKELSNSTLSMENRIRDKFRGCLVGALIGDCIGTLFECDYTVSTQVLGDLYLSLTNLSEDEKQMDLHGIDSTLGPKLAQELLERKRLSIIPASPQMENKMFSPSSPKRHSSFERRRGSFSRPIEKFSDDTVMTRAVIISLKRTKGFDPRDMAIQLTEDYFLNISRKFQFHSREIFTQLRNSGFSDPYGPSKKLSESIGSMGNEGATRCAPIALLLWKSDATSVSEMTSKLTKITNYHKSAVIGAACQAIAVHTAFNWDIINNDESSQRRGSGSRRNSKITPSPHMKRRVNDQENIPLSSKNGLEFDYKEFCTKILEGISHVESKTASLFENLKSLMNPNRESVEHVFEGKINTILEFMERQEPPSRLEVVESLGNGMKAVNSVPSALFSFLMSASSVKFTELPVHIKNPVLRSIFYAISLGGDSDTTASMAGAIAGAFWGYENIPEEILRVCEGSKDILKLADELYNHSQSKL